MRRIALLLTLVSCSRKPEPAPAASAPPQGLAILELIEENSDTLPGPLRIDDRNDEERVAPESRLAVRVRRIYAGTGRVGEVVDFRQGGATLSLSVPRGGDRVGGGIRTPFESVLARVRVWPGDLSLRRDGDAVVVSIAGREWKLEPGGEADLGEASHRARVIQETPDEGTGSGEVVHPGIRRIDLGEAEFRTKLKIRYVEKRP